MEIKTDIEMDNRKIQRLKIMDEMFSQGEWVSFEDVRERLDKIFYRILDPYFDGDETQKIFLNAVHALPEKQQMVFNLKYFKEMKYEEISEILGTSIGALKASYHHAVKKIEKFLKAHS